MMVRRILDRTSAGRRGWILGIERCEDFLPGQVIGLAREGMELPRWYALARPASQSPGRYEVLFVPVEGGALSPELARAEPGDHVGFLPPRGSFRDPCGDTGPLGDGGRVWWICHGTAVAPFACFFRAGIREGHTLVHGAVSEAEAWFAPEFLAHVIPDDNTEGFGYIPCLSRQTGASLPGAWEGRLTGWIRREGASRFGPADRFMICGSPAMVVEVREILTGLGVSRERMDCETWF